MTIDEAIEKHRKIAEMKKTIYDACILKEYNRHLLREYKEHEQIAEWLEELKSTKSSDIPIIHGKEELELHDNEIRVRAVDDLMEKVSECVIFDEDWNYLLQESEKLKVGGENDN